MQTGCIPLLLPLPHGTTLSPLGRHTRTEPAMPANLLACISLLMLLRIHIHSMGVQIPATWQGVTQAQISPAQQLATGVAGTAIPQATGVVAYPIQQFQVSPQVCFN